MDGKTSVTVAASQAKRTGAPVAEFLWKRGQAQKGVDVVVTNPHGKSEGIQSKRMGVIGSLTHESLWTPGPGLVTHTVWRFVASVPSSAPGTSWLTGRPES